MDVALENINEVEELATSSNDVSTDRWAEITGFREEIENLRTKIGNYDLTKEEET